MSVFKGDSSKISHHSRKAVEGKTAALGVSFCLGHWPCVVVCHFSFPSVVRLLAGLLRFANPWYILEGLYFPFPRRIPAIIMACCQSMREKEISWRLKDHLLFDDIRLYSYPLTNEVDYLDEIHTSFKAADFSISQKHNNSVFA